MTESLSIRLASRRRTVSVLDTGTNTVVTSVPVGTSPAGVAMHPTAPLIYVANFGGNSVSVLNTDTNTVVATVPVGVGPTALGQFVGP